MKIYVLNRIVGVADSLLLQLLEAKQEKVGGLFQSIETAPFKDMVTFVDTPEAATYVMLPHNYFSIATNKAYLNDVERLAQAHGKKVLIFAYGDSGEPICMESAIIMRTSQYKSTLQKNEIIVPPFVEDVGAQYGYAARAKGNQKPVVGFAGWSGFSSWFRFAKYLVKLLYTFGAKRQGIYFRRKVLRKLQQSPQITPAFKLRKSFSAHKNDIEDTPEKVRQEYVDIIQRSDLALAVRGDGNYSLRFFEILSLGRVPLYIDTDTALPLENELPYDQCMVRVDYRDIERVTAVVTSFWNRVSPTEYMEMQAKAHTLFTEKLHAPAFYKNLFENL